MNIILIILLVITTISTIYFARLAYLAGKNQNIWSEKLSKDYAIVLRAFLEFLRQKKEAIEKENESFLNPNLKSKDSLSPSENLSKARKMSESELQLFLKSKTTSNQRSKMIDQALDENDLDMVMKLSAFEINNKETH